ncbi:hypothetical protein F4804DRAFT_65817 [Jackrogersella minutella]|nr:hypothetical protein F4804DRAFT_65817 [Jackrogersella minutella]
MDLDNDPEYNPSGRRSSPGPPSLRKRRRLPTEPPSAPALKRQKGVFNARYLAVLNEDISDVSSGLVKEGPHPLQELKDTQLGAVFWSAPEKEAFFSAAGRLGRDDLPGIARRIGSKSELEVRQYQQHLATASRARRADASKRQRSVHPTLVPSAAELSTELAAALDGAADGVALRQEAHETAVEQKRWGGRWLITRDLARVLSRQAADVPPFAELFVLRSWLALPDRVFMNSSVPDGSWRAVSPDAPAIRASALADFYSLALSVTRRLVGAALYAAGSRVRARNAGDRRGRTSLVVRVGDVRAAAASVGLREGSREFWARAARRLRLEVLGDEDEGDGGGGDDVADDVADDEDEDEEDEDEDVSEGESEDSDILDAAKVDVDEEEDIPSDMEDSELSPMSYTEVEAALGFPPPTTHETSNSDNDPESPPKSGFHTNPDSFSDASSIADPEFHPSEAETEEDSDSDTRMKAPSPSSPTIDPVTLEQDLIEALTYSALDHVPTSRSKQALRQRLKNEQRLWADAESFDVQASAAEEARLWGLLRGDKEDEKQEPAGAKVGQRSGLVDLVGDWRDHTEYYSEWEFAERRNRLDDSND